MSKPEYVYVASSWRNPLQPAVVATLRAAGIDCYDFRDPAGDGSGGFSWKDVDPEPDAPTPMCEECHGTRHYYGERCGCGPGVSHVVDCGRPARPCPACAGTPVKGSDWVPAARYLTMLSHPAALDGYARDYAAMERADAFVMVLPCGKSAHLEAGWAMGAGKPVAILLEDPVEPELMYRTAFEGAGELFTSLFDLLGWLGVED